jgi:hypothetical protein
MRHSASLLASLEGMSRPAFFMARELTNNSRSGLTVRFLSKKLEMSEEEIEYLLDLNHRLMFIDLTKVKIVAEGYNAVKRITDGLENHGDVPSLFRRIKALNAHEFRQLEEHLGLEQPATKKGAGEELLERCYKSPDGVVTYVATHNFSELARELFDIVWQSADGLMPVSQIRVAHGGPEFEVEQGLAELFRGFALFEMFRFDSEDRLVRVAGLLSEIRQFREEAVSTAQGKARLKPHKLKPTQIESRGLTFSETICTMVAALAARPARLRGDGELFREDRRRLEEICGEGEEPSMNTCLWVAEGVEWLVRVDDELRVGHLESLLNLGRVKRHRIIYDWMVAKGDEAAARKLLASSLDELKPATWYAVPEVLEYALAQDGGQEQAMLRPVGAHWEYASGRASGNAHLRLAHAVQETLFWLGIVERAGLGGQSYVIALTPLGEAFLNNQEPPTLKALFPERQGEFVVQPNFDIVVPTQDMDPLLTVPLDQFALRQSSGLATVYHVTKESFTHAVQEGHDAGAFVDFLLRHNRGESLPANVMMTLEDWRGTMKRVRMRTVQLLESDDPLIMADLLHRRRFTKHFAHLDPRLCIAFDGISGAELAKALEKDGFVVE